MKKTSALLLMIVAALLFTACSPKASQTTPQPAAQPAALIAEGRLVPALAQDQAFSLPGQVAEVLVQDGAAVTAGQPLARLNDSPEAQLALANAKLGLLTAQQALDDLKSRADLALAQARQAVVNNQAALDDAQKRYDNDASDKHQAELNTAAATLKLSQDVLAKLENANGQDPAARAAAEARLAAAQAALTSAQAAVDALTLQASLDGTLVDLALQPGQRVGTGQPVMTVADLSNWLVETDNLTEVDVARVSLGQKVEVVFDALPDVTLAAEVTHINARFEEKRGDITYTVTLKLTQADPRLRWGMTAAIKFVQ